MPRKKPQKSYPIKEEFTPNEILDLLVDYDIKHHDYLPSNNTDERLMGLTDSAGKVIELSRQGSIRERRTALIHELLHAYHDETHQPVDHKQIYQEAEFIHKKFYEK